jgi:hypothetical protein
MKLWIQLNKHRVKFLSLVNIAMYTRVHKSYFPNQLNKYRLLMKKQYFGVKSVRD